MHNIMKMIVCFAVPQDNVVPNLPTHVNPSKRKSDQEVNKSEYRFESVRLESFKDWPCLWITGKSLAAAGFYYTGEVDKLRCFTCGIEICGWYKARDDPKDKHRRWSPMCRFINNIPCDNVPIGTELSTIPPKGIDECGPFTSSPIDTSLRSKYSEYDNYDARVATFETWPHALTHLRNNLAAAGMFYTGNSDITICHQCGGGLKNWELKDDPWQEHAKYYKNCSYLRRVRGCDWVNEIIERIRILKLETAESSMIGTSDEQFKKADNMSIASESSQNPTRSQGTVQSAGFNAGSAKGSSKGQSTVTIFKNKLLCSEFCKFCCIRRFEVMFLPCRHVMACEECARNISVCKICQRPVKLSYRLFFS